MDFLMSLMNFLSSVLASRTRRDMSSVTLRLEPRSMLDLRSTSSRSLYSSNVAADIKHLVHGVGHKMQNSPRTGLQPDTSGPVCILQTYILR